MATHSPCWLLSMEGKEMFQEQMIWWKREIHMKFVREQVLRYKIVTIS